MTFSIELGPYVKAREGESNSFELHNPQEYEDSDHDDENATLWSVQDGPNKPIAPSSAGGSEPQHGKKYTLSGNSIFFGDHEFTVGTFGSGADLEVESSNQSLSGIFLDVIPPSNVVGRALPRIRLKKPVIVDQKDGTQKMLVKKGEISLSGERRVYVPLFTHRNLLFPKYGQDERNLLMVIRESHEAFGVDRERDYEGRGLTYGARTQQRVRMNLEFNPQLVISVQLHEDLPAPENGYLVFLRDTVAPRGSGDRGYLQYGRTLPHSSGMLDSSKLCKGLPGSNRHEVLDLGKAVRSSTIDARQKSQLATERFTLNLTRTGDEPDLALLTSDRLDEWYFTFGKLTSQSPVYVNGIEMKEGDNSKHMNPNGHFGLKGSKVLHVAQYLDAESFWPIGVKKKDGAELVVYQGEVSLNEGDRLYYSFLKDRRKEMESRFGFDDEDWMMTVK